MYNIMQVLHRGFFESYTAVFFKTQKWSSSSLSSSDSSSTEFLAQFTEVKYDSESDSDSDQHAAAAQPANSESDSSSSANSTGDAYTDAAPQPSLLTRLGYTATYNDFANEQDFSSQTASLRLLVGKCMRPSGHTNNAFSFTDTRSLDSAYLLDSDILYSHETGSYTSVSKPLIVRSPFVPRYMATHLMTSKGHSAESDRYVDGALITNMEALMHTFVSAVFPVEMCADFYQFKDGTNLTQRLWYTTHQYSQGQHGYVCRPTIVVSCIEPDCMFSATDDRAVMLKLLQVTDEELIGVDLQQAIDTTLNAESSTEDDIDVVRRLFPGYDGHRSLSYDDPIRPHYNTVTTAQPPLLPVHQLPPLPETKMNPVYRTEYDLHLLRHMVYSLLREVRYEDDRKRLVSTDYTTRYVGCGDTAVFDTRFYQLQHTSVSDVLGEFRGVAFVVNGMLLCARLSFMAMYEQINNELCALSELCPRGFVYTINPTKVLTAESDVASTTNKPVFVFDHLRIFAFFVVCCEQPRLAQLITHVVYDGDDTFDEITGMRKVVQQLNEMRHSHICFMSRDEIGPNYTNPPKDASFPPPGMYPLVLHANSHNGMKQYFESWAASNQGGNSEDVIGAYSTAKFVLQQDRPDLTDFQIVSGPDITTLHSGDKKWTLSL